MIKVTKETKGITLIALIITIIVLLILAGISIATLTGENGILTKAKLAKDKNEESSIKEEIILAIEEIYAEKLPKEKVTKEKLAGWLSEKLPGLIITEITEEKIKVEYKGYEFEINSKNKVKVLGKVEVKVSYSTEPEGYSKDNVTINLKFELKEGIRVQSVISETENIEIIEENTKYRVNKNGMYTFKIITNMGYEKEISIMVNKIDKEAPNVKIELIEKIIYTNSQVKARVTIEDEKVGVDFTKCKWIINQNSGQIGVNEALYTGDILNEEIKTEKISTQGTYFLHVLATDRLGNVKEYISEAITVKLINLISTPQDLQNIKNNLKGEYLVVNDIDMKDFNFTRIKGVFNGSIDGQGYTISNLKISENNNYVGMFEELSTSTFKNIMFKDVNISGAARWCGVFAGYVAEKATVNFEKVGITGTIEGAGSIGSFFGGTHYYVSLSFRDCFARTSIISTGKYDGAGFAPVSGHNVPKTKLERCYFSGTNSATSRSSSFISLFHVDNNNNKMTSSNINITDCYYNKELFPLSIAPSLSGNGLTTEKMKQQESYIGWDFENTWYMGSEDYPELKFIH